MKTKQKALALAAVLAATVLTGGAAILGLVHRPVAATAPAVPTAVVQHAPAAHSWSEEGD
jgi:chemotaxis response regulator CheB